MATQEKTWNVANRLHSLKDSDNPEVNHIIAGADEIYDDTEGARQSDINAQVDGRLDEVETDLNASGEGIKDRVHTLEEQVAFEGEFEVENTPQGIVTGSGKVTSANAVRGAIDVRTGYFECTTASGTASKEISAPGFVLSAGGSIKIKMANANTADNATLNINSTDAKALYYAGERASANNSWEARETVEVYYDGTNYYANNVTGGSSSGDGAFDVSAKYPTSGVDGGNTYTLEGALAVLNANLSANKKKGGMSIKFIQSSDNKYVQFRCKATSFSTNPSDWVNIENELAALNASIEYLNDYGTIPHNIATEVGYINPTTGEDSYNDNQHYRRTEYIRLANVESISCTVASPACVYALYDGSKTIIGQREQGTGSPIDFGSAAYIRIAGYSSATITEEYLLSGITCVYKNSYFQDVNDRVGAVEDSIAYSEVLYNSTCFSFSKMKQSDCYFTNNDIIRKNNGDKSAIFPISRLLSITVTAPSAHGATAKYLSDYNGIDATVVGRIDVAAGGSVTKNTSNFPANAKYLAINIANPNDCAPESVDLKFIDLPDEHPTLGSLSSVQSNAVATGFSYYDAVNNGNCSSFSEMKQQDCYFTNGDVMRKNSGDKSVIFGIQNVVSLTIAAPSNHGATAKYLSSYDGESATIIGRIDLSANMSTTVKSVNFPTGTRFVAINIAYPNDVTPESVNIVFKNQNQEYDFHNIELAYSAKKRFLSAEEQEEAGLTVDSALNNCSSLLQITHITDVHADWVRARRAFALAQKIGATMINTGDTSLSYGSANKADYDAIVGSFSGKYIHCLGNHDTWGFTTEEAVYDAFISPYATRFGWNLAGEGKTYYYKDDTDYNIRYIVLDQWLKYDNVSIGGFNYSQAEIDWFITTLLSVPANYGVIVVMHSPEGKIYKSTGYEKFFQNKSFRDNIVSEMDYSVVYKIVDAWISKSTISESVTVYTTLTLSADFTSVLSNEFIGYICGHTHEDGICYVPNVTNRQVLLLCTCTNSRYVVTGSSLAGYSDVARVEDEPTQDAFNIYTIDRDNKAIRIVRIGSDLPYDLSEKRDYMIIPYA